MSHVRRVNHFIPSPRRLVLVMFLLDVGGFIVSISTYSYNAMSLTLHLTRIFSYLVLFVVSNVRKNRDFYLPILHEFSDDDYWMMAGMTLAILRVTITGGIDTHGPYFKLLDVFTSSVTIVLFYMSYVRNYWNSSAQFSRERRIAFLTRKAKLTEEEKESIKDVLVDVVDKHQKPPFVWQATVWAVSLIVAILINNYAAQILEVIKLLGLELRNILPPY